MSCKLCVLFRYVDKSFEMLVIRIDNEINVGLQTCHSVFGIHIVCDDKLVVVL